jgi:hypothetical protein
MARICDRVSYDQSGRLSLEPGETRALPASERCAALQEKLRVANMVTNPGAAIESPPSVRLTAAAIVDGWLSYQRDFSERSILFWDTLRQGADNMLEHERLGLPPLLKFKAETLLDARTFARPVNYALLRITEVEAVTAEACVDADKPLVLYGNCQAGWAITLLASDCEGLLGPAVLNGSPLSYWAGEAGVNPRRLLGGLLSTAITGEVAHVDAGLHIDGRIFH